MPEAIDILVMLLAPFAWQQITFLTLIRSEPGNLRYEYYRPLDDPETGLLIDSRADQAAIDAHHASPRMATIAALWEKYDLHMTVERFVGAEENETDRRFIRK